MAGGCRCDRDSRCVDRVVGLPSTDSTGHKPTDPRFCGKSRLSDISERRRGLCVQASSVRQASQPASGRDIVSGSSPTMFLSGRAARHRHMRSSRTLNEARIMNDQRRLYISNCFSFFFFFTTSLRALLLIISYGWKVCPGGVTYTYMFSRVSVFYPSPTLI